MRRSILLLAVALATACGGSSVAVSTDGSGVMADAQDGHLDKNWSCGSLIAALGRFSPTVMRSVGAPDLAAKTCDRALLGVEVGATKEEVLGLLGPSRIPSSRFARGCWFYSWQPARLSPIDGARVCFKAGKVRLIKRSLHG